MVDDRNNTPLLRLTAVRRAVLLQQTSAKANDAESAASAADSRAANAQSMARNVGAAANSAQTVADSAKATANGVAEAAASAKSKADSAASAATSAGSMASGAKTAAEDAAKVAADAAKLASDAAKVAADAAALAAKKPDKVSLGAPEITVGGVVAVSGPKSYIVDAPGAQVGDVLETVPPDLPDAYYLVGPSIVVSPGKVKIRLFTPALIIATVYKWKFALHALR